MHTCNVKLRYFDWDGQVHLTKGKAGGQKGDPLEVFTFNLTIHHLWGRVFPKFQGARVISYCDDGYIKTKLSVTLQVLTEFKVVFKEVLNVTKTTILPVYGVTHQTAFDVANIIITTNPTLTHLRTEIALDSFLT
jgi:hypothetical protein